MSHPISRKQATEAVLAGRLKTPSTRGTAWAPVNIALCKYWGKRNPELNLPLTSSLSVSLGALGTRTTISPSETDSVTLNGVEQAPDSPFVSRLFAFINVVRDPAHRLSIATENAVPTAAGLASSASGFAACVGALNSFYNWGLSPKEQSILARMGSGSACRSVFEGFVQWHAGMADDGSDSFAEQLPWSWPELRVGLCLLESGPKSTPSTQGMIHTVETSLLYRSWATQVDHDLEKLRRAIADNDFGTMGQTAENNALAMHATMIAANPPLIYWTAETVNVIQKVHALRTEGLDIYLTMDAGPNVKLLFQKENQETVVSQFPGLQVCQPFS